MSYFISNYQNTITPSLNSILPELNRLNDKQIINDTRKKKLHDLFKILHYGIKESASYVCDIINNKMLNGKISVKPWFNDTIIEMQKEVKWLHDKYLEAKDDYFEIKSKEIGKQLQKIIRDEESRFKRNELHNLEKMRYYDSKRFWSILDIQKSKL